MFRTVLLSLLALYLLASLAWIVSTGIFRPGDELLNVACDPTRELWHDINLKFVARHEAKTGQHITVRQSHGGSGSQARAVIDGLDADVVTLALWSDTDAIRKAGRIDPGWENDLPNRSLPYTSTIVFVVRKGNPKQLHDWSDLLRLSTNDHGGVITPNPKTSGNGKWSFLALWGSITQRGGSETEARAFVTDVFRRVPILDTAARAATMTFAQRNIGDVHLTWENEAHLEVQESGGALEIVYPPTSVLAEPYVAVVDAVVRSKGTRTVAEEYLRFLYTDEAQDIIAQHYHRPTSPAARARYADRFPQLTMFRATELAPSWDELQQRFFAEGAVFDQILADGRN